MNNPSETREYDLAAIVKNQTPEQREATANAIAATLESMVIGDLMRATTRNRFTLKPARIAVLQVGKSRLTSAIKQAIT